MLVSPGPSSFPGGPSVCLPEGAVELRIERKGTSGILFWPPGPCSMQNPSNPRPKHSACSGPVRHSVFAKKSTSWFQMPSLCHSGYITQQALTEHSLCGHSPEDLGPLKAPTQTRTCLLGSGPCSSAPVLDCHSRLDKTLRLGTWPADMS